MSLPLRHPGVKAFLLVWVGQLAAL